MNAEVCDHLSQVDIEGIAKTALAPLASEKIDCAVEVCDYEVLYLYLSVKDLMTKVPWFKLFSLIPGHSWTQLTTIIVPIFRKVLCKF